jgi:hypothetical protein
VPAAFGAAISLAAWPIFGHAVAVPVVAVGGISVLAGVIDARTCRIPNRLAVVALFAFLAGAVVTSIGDHRPPAEVAGTALVGVIAVVRCYWPSCGWCGQRAPVPGT